MRATVLAYAASFATAAALITLCSQPAAPQSSVARPPQEFTDAQLTVPVRPSTPEFHGEQGKQRSELTFNRTTRIVTLKIQVQDPNGYFLPNIRRENFAVYEDGIRQKDVNVEVEHAPITAALLLEFGGRYEELNKTLAFEVPSIARELLNEIGPKDKIAVFKYAGHVETLADFNKNPETLDGVFDQLSTPGFSEANFYDALINTIQRMQPMQGRKAILAITSGLDTFSKASYQETIDAARNSSAPIYIIGLTRLMAQQASLYGSSAPFAHIDWKNAEQRLESLAQASGGRTYFVEADLQIPAIYDDIMENLRLRYVITYVSSDPKPPNVPRNIRVELIDPQTGAPLQIRDADGKPITPRLFVKTSYTPASTAGS